VSARLVFLVPQRAEPNEIVTMRLEILIEDVTRSMYVMVCRGLFEKDKMLYAFMMCANILRHAGVISAAEWKTFMVGPGTADPKANPAPSSVKWMNANLWSDLVMMESTIKEVYGGLPKHVASQHDQWKARSRARSLLSRSRCFVFSLPTRAPA
jgi:dynein heavy chain